MIGIAQQMGILDIRNAMPHATKCDSWQQIEASQSGTVLVVLRLEDIYGPAILIAAGLLSAMIAFCFEATGAKLLRQQRESLLVQARY